MWPLAGNIAGQYRSFANSRQRHARRAIAIRKFECGARHQSGKKFLRIEREKPHRRSASGCDVGANIDFAEVRGGRNWRQAAQPQVAHVERHESDVGLAFKSVEFNARWKESLNDVRFVCPMSKK